MAIIDRILYLIWVNFSYFPYKLLFAEFNYKTFVHPCASIRNHNKISFGKNVTINRNVTIWVLSLKIGDNVGINPNTCIYGRVIIGDNVMIAPNCMIASGNHGISDTNFPMIKQACTTKGDIIIGNDVWIASNSVILDGVKVGEGAVVAAGSIVTNDVPPFSIVAGNPARIIKYRKEPI